VFTELELQIPQLLIYIEFSDNVLIAAYLLYYAEQYDIRILTYNLMKAILSRFWPTLRNT